MVSESSEVLIGPEDFWSSLKVYIERPNVIGNRWMGARPLRCWTLAYGEEHDKEKETGLMAGNNEENNSQQDWNAVIKDFQEDDPLKNFHPRSSTPETFLAVENPSWEDLDTLIDPDSNVKTIIVIRELFEKKSLKKLINNQSNPTSFTSDEQPIIDLIIVDLFKTKVHVIPHSESSTDVSQSPGHIISLTDNKSLTLEYIRNDQLNESKWLTEVVLPKLRKWAVNNSEKSNSFQGSLSLVPIDIYCRKYEELKIKYAPKLVEIWSSIENTDPKKFVYEDLAIAAYLIALWEGCGQSIDDVKFLDLGCGNGLLVHLLNQEGYNGFGWDVRKRKIWSHYTGSFPTRLEEVTFQPGVEDSESMIKTINILKSQGTNWVIGNHSDELTPWIPYLSSVIAANCFLLPCCSYDFSGRKFQRTVAGISKYQAYLAYIEEVCTKVGFASVLKDRLRIPSTKKISFICKHSDSANKTESSIKSQRIDFIRQRLSNLSEQDQNDQVTVRSAVEPVRNCTQLPADFKQLLISLIQDLLKDKSLSLGQLAGQLESSILKQLKNQCGGLQTFLKNHKSYFTISNGLVALKTE